VLGVCVSLSACVPIYIIYIYLERLPEVEVLQVGDALEVCEGMAGLIQEVVQVHRLVQIDHLDTAHTKSTQG
jgi:hypothetical protein